jgi:predicted peptidase
MKTHTNRPYQLGAAAWIALALALGCALNPARAQDYVAQVYTGASGATMPYRLLAPERLRQGSRYPLVLFFHGAGERGTDNATQLRHGTRLFLKPDIRAKYPCFVLAPQCPSDQRWVEMDWNADRGAQPASPSRSMQLAVDLVQYIQRSYPVDTHRLYVTGLSMGGYATWDFVTRFPDQVAAAVPVCGGGDDAAAARAARVPVWAFHADNDTTVKVGRTRDMIGALRLAGAKPHYFEYPGLGHNSWDAAYAEPELIPWMFSQRCGKPDTYRLTTPAPRKSP